jgi:hypothetical protein
MIYGEVGGLKGDAMWLRVIEVVQQDALALAW